MYKHYLFYTYAIQRANNEEENISDIFFRQFSFLLNSELNWIELNWFMNEKRWILKMDQNVEWILILLRNLSLNPFVGYGDVFAMRGCKGKWLAFRPQYKYFLVVVLLFSSICFHFCSFPFLLKLFCTHTNAHIRT